MSTEYNNVKPSVKPDIGKGGGERKEKNIKQVTTGEVTKVKRGLMERLVTSFVGPDGIRAVGRYVGHEVIAPAVKAIIADSVTTGINSIMYGPDGRHGGRSSYNRATGYGQGNRGGYQRTQYNKPNSYGPGYDDEPMVSVKQGRFNSSDYILSSRNEALTVIENLADSANDYGQVTVADFKDTIGVTTEFTDNNFGWRSVDDFTVQAYRSGFIINSPRAGKL